MQSFGRATRHRRTKQSSLCLYPTWTWHQCWCQVCPSLLRRDKLGDGLQTIWAVGEKHLSRLLALSSISLRVQVTLNWSTVKNLVFLFHLGINELRLIYLHPALGGSRYRYRSSARQMAEKKKKKTNMKTVWINHLCALHISSVISWGKAASVGLPMLNDTGTLMYDIAAPFPDSFLHMVNSSSPASE